MSPVEAEARLSYTALGDLLDLELPPLPAPQERALDAALLRDRSEGPPPDRRAVSLAMLGVFRALASSGPVTIAIDDIQWLDAPSARVLSFAARRLRDEPIALLLALRSGHDIERLGLGETTASTERLPIRPLPEGAMLRLLRNHIGDDLGHPVLLRLHRASQGNPFFALEIARALADRAIPSEPGEPVPVPDDLQQLLRARLGTLPSSAVEALVAAAAATRPTMELVVGSAGDPDHALAGIAEAEEADIIRVDGERIDFSHPLLGSTVYAAASTGTRRRVHARLAELVVDPEERARHLALAAPGPEPAVAEALDTAAWHASARGASDAAADLAELARKLTPPGDLAARVRRSVDAAVYQFDAGDAMRAFSLLEEAIEGADPGLGRAAIIFQLAAISWLDLGRVESLCQQAIEEAEGDPRISATALEHLAWVGIYRGDLGAAAAQVQAASEYVDRMDDLSIKADVVATSGMVEFLRGRPADHIMSEAMRLQDQAMAEAPANAVAG